MTQSTPRYRRNWTGEVIHRFDCARAGRTSLEWTYAEGMPPEWVHEQAEQIAWLRCCQVCLPSRQSAPSAQ